MYLISGGPSKRVFFAAGSLILQLDSLEIESIGCVPEPLSTGAHCSAEHALLIIVKPV